MADISKCLNNEQCPHKDKCYYSTAIEGIWQSYMDYMSSGMCDGENNYEKLWIRGENNESK